MTQETKAAHEASDETPRAELSREAVRALEEAALRRQEQDRAAAPAAVEVGGRPGPDATRYGDWEKAGVVSDF